MNQTTKLRTTDSFFSEFGSIEETDKFIDHNQTEEVVTITNTQLNHCLESMDAQDSPEEVYKQVYTPMLIKTQRKEEKIILGILDTGNTLAYSVMVVGLQQE